MKDTTLELEIFFIHVCTCTSESQINLSIA